MNSAGLLWGQLKTLPPKTIHWTDEALDGAGLPKPSHAILDYAEHQLTTIEHAYAKVSAAHRWGART